ncbi:MAG: type II toxin-antitoxin system RelB/DinJ family antitoxin [Coriobacteriales bacterium]|jgi:addiction module RelB/DinJ family antitoxin|nr:type II toxin-antitoxin system RelB/DinJ family antitoxin [Coriobacteriales bacterium]
MTRTAEIKIRVEPTLKHQATELFGGWGLSLSDAVSLFLHQSIKKGGIPFDVIDEGWGWSQRLDKSKVAVHEIDPHYGHALLPEDLDFEGDAAYDRLSR